MKSSERGNVKFRRSLYFVKDMKAGEVITEECVRSVRPGFGLAPKHYDKLIGKIVKYPTLSGTPVNLDSIVDEIKQ